MIFINQVKDCLQCLQFFQRYKVISLSTFLSTKAATIPFFILSTMSTIQYNILYYIIIFSLYYYYYYRNALFMEIRFINVLKLD